MGEHDLWNEIGNLYFLSGKYDRAALSYRKAIQCEPNFGKAYSNLALVYSRQANYQDAMDLYKKSLDLLTEDTEKAVAWNRLGNVYRHLKEYQEAVSAYQRSDELKASAVAKRKQPDQVLYVALDAESLSYETVDMQLGYQNHSDDYLCTAEPEFDKAWPVPAPVMEQAGTPPILETVETVGTPNLGTELEQFHSAVEVLVEELAPQPEEMALPEVYPALEEVKTHIDESMPASTVADLNSREETTESSSCVIQPIAQAETQFEALSNMQGQMRVETPDIAVEEEEKTEPWLTGWIAMDDDLALTIPSVSVNVLFETSTFSEEGIQQSESALEVPATLVEDGPEKEEQISATTSEALATDTVQHRTDENPMEADQEVCVEEEKLTRQIEISPRNATSWEALGMLYKASGRYEEALDAFKQAIALAPGKVSYYHNLGLVYSAQGNGQEAFNTFHKVIEMDPNHGLAHASLGGYYKKMGLDELAQKHIEKAMKQIYESENEYNRACLDAICGKIDSAISLLRTALENKQTYVEWIIHDPDLDDLHEDNRFKQLISDFINK